MSLLVQGDELFPSGELTIVVKASNEDIEHFLAWLVLNLEPGQFYVHRAQKSNGRVIVVQGRTLDAGQ